MIEKGLYTLEASGLDGLRKWDTLGTLASRRLLDRSQIRIRTCLQQSKTNLGFTAGTGHHQQGLISERSARRDLVDHALQNTRTNQPHGLLAVFLIEI